MDTIGRDDLAVLTGNGGLTCVSLYSPMVRVGPRTAQNPIRWKNLLAQVEDALRDEGTGMSTAEVDALLDPARGLLHDRVFWENQGSGLAFFARPGWSQWFRLPVGVPFLATVGEHFLVAPLLDVLAARRFLLLTLTRNRARLFTGTRFGLEEAAGAVPAEPVADRQTRDRPDAYVTGRGRAGAGIMFYARGDVDQRHREETLQYFRAVDAAVTRLADGARPPLLLVADEDLLPLYRQASTYPGIVARGLAPDLAQIPLDTLHARAWNKVESLLGRDDDIAVARYERLQGTGRTVVGPPAVLAAAVAGRVDTLLLTRPVVTRRSDSPTVLRLDAHAPTVLEQVDRAAAACLAHGGAVYTVPLEQLPHAGPAAVLRS